MWARLPGRGTLQAMLKPNLFRDFKTSPEVIRLAVMMYIRFPLSLRNVEDLPRALIERPM